MTEIKVSIICSVFNHGKYIRRCLEGFVSQKTNFNYEVLIHDDASTDNSAQVIREFEEKYPEIIKPIYQTENQFSKKIPINITYQFPRVKGKYIAICEGDDYWVDEYKLQKQVDYMDAHPDCTFCFTNGYIEDISDNGKMRDFIPYNSEDAAVYTGESREYALRYERDDFRSDGVLPYAYRDAEQDYSLDARKMSDGRPALETLCDGVRIRVLS